MTDPDVPDVRITLRPAAPVAEPLAVLTRRLLKHLLRRWGLKCVAVEWLPRGEPREGEHVAQ